jgi:hypothetical protein
MNERTREKKTSVMLCESSLRHWSVDGLPQVHPKALKFPFNSLSRIMMHLGEHEMQHEMCALKSAFRSQSE